MAVLEALSVASVIYSESHLLRPWRQVPLFGKGIDEEDRHEVIGALQVLNKTRAGDGAVIPFSKADQDMMENIAVQVRMA